MLLKEYVKQQQFSNHLTMSDKPPLLPMALIRYAGKRRTDLPALQFQHVKAR
jgi:hypothetical protein